MVNYRHHPSSDLQSLPGARNNARNATKANTAMFTATSQTRQANQRANFMGAHHAFFALILLLLSAQLALSATWYASPSATDAGDGSLANPFPLWRSTTNRGAILAGDTLYLRGGNYVGYFFYTLTNVTMRSYPSEWAVLKDGLFGTLMTALPNNSTTIAGVGIANSESWPDTLTFSVGSEVLYPGLRTGPTNFTIIRAWAGSSFAAHSIGDRVIPYAAAILEVQGTNNTFRDFEVAGQMTTNRSAGYSWGVGPGINVNGYGNKVINVIVRNVGHPAIGFWDQGEGSEVNGCLIFDNGVYQTVGFGGAPNGSAIYAQNSGGLAKVKNCINFRNFTTGGKVFGEGGPVRDFQFITNISFVNGLRPLESASGSTGMSNIWFDGNIMMATPLLAYLSPSNTHQFFINNTVVGGVFYTVEHWNSTYTNNTVFLPNNSVGDTDQTISYSSTYFPSNDLNIDWNRNVWYHGSNSVFGEATFRTASGLALNSGGGGRLYYQNDSGKAWKDWSHFDTDSTYSTNYPATFLKVQVAQSDYDTNRWHIGVVAIVSSNSVNLDLSAIGFKHGRRYRLRDAQNYSVVVAEANWNGVSRLALPLNLTTIPADVGTITHMTNRHTNVDAPGLFNAFVLTSEEPVIESALSGNNAIISGRSSIGQ